MDILLTYTGPPPRHSVVQLSILGPRTGCCHRRVLTAMDPRAQVGSCRGRWRSHPPLQSSSSPLSLLLASPLPRRSRYLSQSSSFETRCQNSRHSRCIFLPPARNRPSSSLYSVNAIQTLRFAPLRPLVPRIAYSTPNGRSFSDWKWGGRLSSQRSIGVPSHCSEGREAMIVLVSEFDMFAHCAVLDGSVERCLCTANFVREKSVRDRFGLKQLFCRLGELRDQPSIRCGMLEEH